MDRWLLIAIFAIEIVFLGGILLALPRMGRRGLAFGVYVGEDREGSDALRELTSRWYRHMGLVIAVAAGLLILVGRSPRLVAAIPFVTLVLLAGFVLAYLRAHRDARGLAVPPTPRSVATLATEIPSPWLPILTTAIACVVGVGLVIHVLIQFDSLPDRVPVHFDLQGAPDRWADRSLVGLLVLPILASFLGASMGLLAWLLLHAKRSLRDTGDPAPLAASQRFQVAVSRFLCGEALLVTALLSAITVGEIEVATGRATTLGWAPLVLGLGIGGFSMVGAIYLLFRYGQGGALLEGGAAEAPLTNGLADDRFWKLGVFYVNPEDPSYIVEKRFGLGYTINFGRRGAVMGLLGFFAVLIGILVVAVVSS